MSDNDHVLKGPHFVLTTEDGALHGEDTPENRDIVRRIHACVNACDGISTEELEDGVILDMRRTIANVAPLLREKIEANRQVSAKQPLVVNNTLGSIKSPSNSQ